MASIIADEGTFEGGDSIEDSPTFFAAARGRLAATGEMQERDSLRVRGAAEAEEAEEEDEEAEVEDEEELEDEYEYDDVDVDVDDDDEDLPLIRLDDLDEVGRAARGGGGGGSVAGWVPCRGGAG